MQKCYYHDLLLEREAFLDTPLFDMAKTYFENTAVTRELMLVKVKYNKNNRKDIMENCQIMGATIVDMSTNMMLIQMCDTPERILILLEMFKTIPIVEVARTGCLALQKCVESD